MAESYYGEKMVEAIDRIQVPEQMLGIGLRQPFNNCESASRKLMIYNKRKLWRILMEIYTT